LGTSTCIDYEYNHIENTQSTSFLDLILDKTLSWHLHIDKICVKLNLACYILRILNPFLSVSNLRTIYFSYIHSVITYGIIFWGNSTGSDEVFKLQKGLIELLQILIAVPHVVTYYPLMPNDHYSGRTAPLTSKRCIIYIYLTNTGTEYFKHGINSLFFSLQNAVCVIILTYLVPVLFTFYIEGVLKFKKIIPAPKG